jgi:Lrp/AsnC family leucine-responsive transcriptional regulator
MRRRPPAPRSPARRSAAPERRPARERGRTAGHAAQDAKLLELLERDGRLSYADLGEHVGLSKTPTWNRVRSLEERGVITGYRAIVDPAAVGLDIHAFVQVTIRSTMSREFEQAVVRHASVLECYTTAGQADYLLHVLVPNVAALDTLLRNELSRMPGVEHVSTTVGMKTIKPRGYVTECLPANS